MVLVFKDELKTGIYKIDSQHKELFDRVNSLYNACVEGRSHEEIKKTIGYLEKYVLSHFSLEEKYMEECRYPQTNTHTASHNIFRENFNQLKNDFINNEASANLVVKINKLLINWLLDHLGHEDKQLAAFLVNKNI